MTWQELLELTNLALIPIVVGLYKIGARLQRIESIAEAVASLEKRLSNVESVLFNRRP